MPLAPDEAAALEGAAAAWGIERDYWDLWGQHHQVAPEVLRAILRAMGVDTGSRAALESAVEAKEWTRWAQLLPPTVVISTDAPEIGVAAAADAADAELRMAFTFEDGSQAYWAAAWSACPVDEAAEVRGQALVRKRVRLPDLPLGYHRVDATLGGQRASAALIVCPPRAYLPPELEAGRRLTGFAATLWSLRSERNWGCGDFTDLCVLIRWARRELGADFIALNPLHAIPNRTPYNTSPYLPTNTLYRNFLYLDLEQVPELAHWPRFGSVLAGLEPRLAELRAMPTVDYEAVAELKRRLLRLAFRRFERMEMRRATPRAREFDEYCRREGEPLRRFGLYQTLDETIHRQLPDVWIWTDWPAEYQEPGTPQVREFASQHERDIRFFCYVQWLIDQQLAAVQRFAREQGMAIGLYHDLALATDRTGADLWAHRDLYMRGCRVGSPPDDFAPEGQDWAFPPPDASRHAATGYRQFALTIRQNCRHGGALRIDHVMRLFRLFWIPDGFTAKHGAYVKDRPADLLRILALESVRQKTLIVGEDLGTVSDEMREQLGRFGILSYRLFYFEKNGDGRFKPPHEYPAQALVCSTTHDLPTLAGFWSGHDLDVRHRAGLLPTEAILTQQTAQRAVDKRRMAESLSDLGFLPPSTPAAIVAQRELPEEVAHGVLAFLAATPSWLMAVNQEDLTRFPEQQNLPGTTSAYPNWRHKMAVSLEELERATEWKKRAAAVRRILAQTGRLPPPEA
jgi:4-alpha-glucanotransferase